MASTPLGPYGFPDVYYTNLVSGASSVKYVSTSGSDTNNGNSIATAYKTIAYAISSNTATATSITIVVLPGTYVEVPIAAGSSYATAALCDGNKPRVFVCSPGQVKIQFSDASMTYGPYPVNFQNSGSAVYGAIFERNNGARTANYATALFCGSATVGNLEGNFYNCGFTETNANGSWALIYDNEGSITSQVNNCTFKFSTAPQADYNGGGGMTISSSVFSTVNPGGNSVKNSTLYSQTVSSTYVTTGVTTAGVYSGTYAWNGTITPQIGLSAPSTAISGGTVTVILNTSGVADGTLVPYTISGVTTAQINNASLTGNFTMSNNTANFSVSTSKYLFITPATMTVTASSYSSSTVVSYPVMSTSVARPAPNTILTTTQPATIKTNVMDRVANTATSGAQLDLTNNQKTVLNNTRTVSKTGSTVLNGVTVDSNTVQKTVSTSMLNSQSGGILGSRSNTTTTTSGGVMNTYVIQPGGGKQPREYWM